MVRNVVSFIVFIGVFGVFYPTRGYAHHPMAALYLIDQQESITGQLVEFQIRNPHSFVFLESLGPSPGQSQRWAVEWLSAVQLGRQGVTSTTLKAGDHLAITGYPSRTPNDRRLRLRTILRSSDGWHWRGTFE